MAPGHDRRICIGQLAGAQGVHGLARIRSFTDDPYALGDYGPVETEDGAISFSITVQREAKPGLMIAEIDTGWTREELINRRGTKLFVSRDALPPADADDDEFYIEDLIGLAAHLEDGSKLGDVTAVQNYGAGDLLDIRLEGSSQIIVIPFTKEAVPTVDLAAGHVTVIPPAGLLD